MKQLNGDLDRRLQSWPELPPDALTMHRTALRMNNYLAALRAASADNLSELQFRFLMRTGTVLSVVIYLAWPSILDFLAENSWCAFTLLCVAVLSLIATVVVLPLLLAERGDNIFPQPPPGVPTC